MRVQREIFGRISLLRRKILFSPFAFSKNAERASERASELPFFFPPDTATDGRGEVTTVREGRGSGNLSLQGGSREKGESFWVIYVFGLGRRGEEPPGASERASGQIPPYQTLDRV